MDAAERKAVLERGRPATLWQGEQMLGSSYDEEEIAAAVAAMRESAEVSVGFGFTSQPILDFEAAFADYVGTKHAIAINSCGPGLDMAMRYLRLAPGDEVIVPAINFHASALAVVGAGGQVVWGEVDETLQLDPADVEARITPRTRAILPTHMNGLSSPLHELLEIAARHSVGRSRRIEVIGDAARACGAGYRGGKVGKLGLMTLYSLHTMKNITTLGEGGMITTDDDDVADFCRQTRFYGQGKVWGSSYVMTKVQAAVGLVQLRKLDSFIARRRELAQQRNAWLADIPELQTPIEPPACGHTYYLYTCLTSPSWGGAKCQALRQLLASDFGIATAVLNPPVYLTNPFLAEHTRGQRLPRSEALGERIFCLSLHPSMSTADNAYIAAGVIECVAKLRHA